jgi:hypothetical protein
MAGMDERVCSGCGDTEEVAILERCQVCQKWYCPDCVYRATGRRFCSSQCAKAFFYGDMDDLEDDIRPDELPDDD